VESPNSPLLAGCPEPAAVVDVREVPLGQLSADSDARRMADRILADTAESSLIAAVSFQSAI
jgi:hypothetical protein